MRFSQIPNSNRFAFGVLRQNMLHLHHLWVLMIKSSPSSPYPQPTDRQCQSCKRQGQCEKNPEILAFLQLLGLVVETEELRTQQRLRNATVSHIIVAFNSRSWLTVTKDAGRYIKVTTVISLMVLLSSTASRV